MNDNDVVHSIKHNSYLGLFMTNYTLAHTETTTRVDASISKGGFNEIIQFEFKQQISDYKIQKVYDSLTDHQKDAVGKHKTGFKQFIRAIALAYPSTAGIGITPVSRSDEAKRYISRLAPFVDMSPSDALNSYFTSGTIHKKKYQSMIANHPDKVVIEDEKLVYVKLNGFVLVAGTEPVVREKEAPALYIYAMFCAPNSLNK